jgi:hypothetical protein
MKKFILIIVIIAFFIYPSICFSSYLIELKNGSTFITNHYWKEGRQIKFYYRGGIVGIEKGLIKGIRESDLPYKEEVVEQKASQTPEITSKEAGKKAGEETKEEREKIDVTFYKNKKSALMERYSEAKKKLQQATKDRNRALQREANNELKEISKQRAALAREIKEKNNGILPKWWQRHAVEEKD